MMMVVLLGTALGRVTDVVMVVVLGAGIPRALVIVGSEGGRGRRALAVPAAATRVAATGVAAAAVALLLEVDFVRRPRPASARVVVVCPSDTGGPAV